MRGLFKVVAIVVLMAAMFGLGWLVAVSGTGQDVAPESLTDLERSFSERMRDVALVGHFTIEGRESRGGNPERYEISQVTKVGDDRWRFDVHMTYLSFDATLPIVVPVVWAGDTPMVAITDVSIPGVGDSLTARVLFYEDHYAGSWRHGQFGGLMYGMIQPADAD